MPIVNDETKLANLMEHQKTCRLCDDEAGKNPIKLICDICTKWVCLDCSAVPEEIYQLANKTNAKMNFFCDPCESEIPKIRDLITVQKNQQQMLDDITNLKTDVDTNRTSIAKQNDENEEIKRRLDAVEKVIHENKLSEADFPPLATLIEGNRKLKEDFTTQTKELGATLKKQQENTEEQKRREAKQSSLIIYGVPEKNIDPTNQMLEDFKTLKLLYSNRINIEKEDISHISRLGEIKPNQIRPIKITCTSTEKRRKILINNKGLKLEGDDYDLCVNTDCSYLPGKHAHVYVTTDKTKQERVEEGKLRQQLKQRRDAGEVDLIIRNGKIINRRTLTGAHPRWAEVSTDV